MMDIWLERVMPRQFPEQDGQPRGKPGKVRDFDIDQGNVREIVVCLRCATAVAIVTK